MNDKFLELAKKYEELKDELKQVRIDLESTMMAMGVDTRLQDPIDGVVYQIVESNGQWVSYSKIDYIRTRKGNEKAGTLSLKKAEEWGFKL